LSYFDLRPWLAVVAVEIAAAATFVLAPMAGSGATLGRVRHGPKDRCRTTVPPEPRSGQNGEMTTGPLSAIVLAAGEGTRMRSQRPKPLHHLCGRPMVLHVLDALAELDIDRVVVVVGHRADWVGRTLTDHAPKSLTVELVQQAPPRGTGDATAVGLTGLPDTGASGGEEGDVVVLPGDTPLLRPPTLAALVRHHRQHDAGATLLTARVADGSGYGRILRDKDGQVAAVVEDADATEEERAITEVNTSIYCFRQSILAPSLRRLRPANQQGEYYLTDVIGVLREAGYRVETMAVSDPMEAAGVNDRAQLAAAEAELRDRINERWMRRGVTMWDPERTYVDAEVQLATDVSLLPGVLLRGECTVGEGAEIGPESMLVDTRVGEGARVRQSVCVGAMIGAGATVGPFASLGPGAVVADGTSVPPFTVVEGRGGPSPEAALPGTR
jgi:bifunctional UDP-N-acetylglucosamine pyrophosphorylase / glucosamine-1-phosphate N-acetyltransferase